MYIATIKEIKIMNIYKKRLSIDIPMDLHDELKDMAKKYNISITKLVINEIVELLIRNRDHDGTKYYE